MDLRIKEVCQDHGITQKELAAKLGVSEMTLSRAAKGNTSLTLIENIVKTLGIPVTELFDQSTGDVSGFVKVKGEIHEVHSFDDLRVLLKMEEK